MTTLNKGDRILVDPTEEVMDCVWATVIEVVDYGYIVLCDGDAPDEYGPVDFHGNIIDDV